VLRDRHDPTSVHPQLVGDVGADPALWQLLTQHVGICSVLAPDELGGLDLGYAEFSAVAGELGGVLYGGPFWGTAVLALPALVAVADSSSVAHALAEQIVEGTRTATLATGAPVRARAAGEQGQWHLTGRVRAVCDAGRVDVVLVHAETEQSPGLFALAAADATVTARTSVDPTRPLADLDLDAAPAQLVALGSDVDLALRESRRCAWLAAASEAVRGAEEALALAVTYAGQRTQFGKPIGAFQAIKHKCADGLIAVQAARSALAYAGTALDVGAPDADRALLAAKAAACDAYVRIAADAIQVHGTFGYTREAVVQSYFRRARWLSLALGTSADDRSELGGELLLRTSGTPPIELFEAGLPGPDDERRRPVREWVAAHPHADGRALLESGYLVPAWSRPLGLGASGEDLVIIEQELRRAGVSRPPYPLARDFVAPLLATAGSPEQQARYIEPMLRGDDVWCELFSEPEAGSDLASLRTTAVRDGAGYRVNGVKIWTSQAHVARYGLLLARTDPAAAKHRGISCFVVAMDAPGISQQPILDMAGNRQWSMVRLDDVRLSSTDLVGAENQGWRIALDVLANERLSMSATPGLLWGEGPSYLDLLELARARNADHPLADHLVQRLVRGYEEAMALHVMRVEAMGRLGYEPSGRSDLVPEVRRALADAHGQAMLELWRDLHGADGVADCPQGEGNDLWAEHYFSARSLTLGGGTSEIQRNVLGERVLGLPRG
jgi:alkylation response protein AidB-like acyl-CoA dehydrogenase